MILAVAVPEDRELIIYGADTLAEQNHFLGEIEDKSPTLLQDTDFTRFFADPELSKLKHPPTILEFPSASELDAFVAQHSIKLTPMSHAPGLQRDMLARYEFNKDDRRTVGEITGYDKFDPFDRRTDEEKAKDADARMAAKSGKKKDAKGSGDLTGDSFGHKSEGYRPDADEHGIMIPPSEEKKQSQLRLRDIEFERDKDGELVPTDPTRPLGPDNLPIIKAATVEKNFMSAEYYHLTLLQDGQPDNRLASYVDLTNHAGMGETNYDIGWDFFAHEEGGIVIRLGGAAIFRLEKSMGELGIARVVEGGKPSDTGSECTLEPMLNELEGVDPNNPYRITFDEIIDIYFRVDAPGHTVADVLAVIKAENEQAPYKSNDVESGSWHAYIRRETAERIVAALVKQGIASEVVEVDREGERYIEEGAGATVVDVEGEKQEPPLPWNDRSAEWDALTEEERMASLKGEYFIYSVRDYGAPTHILVHIQPRSYFAANEELWTGEIPYLDKILPDNFEKYGVLPGLFRVNSLDLNNTDFILGNRAKMKESLSLRAFLNFADKSAFS